MNTDIPISDIKPEDKCPQCGWTLCNPINDESLVCGNPSCGFWGTTPDICPECQGTKIIEGRLTETGEDAVCWRCKPPTPSCLVCGQQNPLVITIAAQPTIGACQDCRDAVHQRLDCERREHDIVREAGDYDVVAVIRDLRNQLHDSRTLRSKYASELQSVANELGMRAAPGHALIAKVKDICEMLASREEALTENIKAIEILDGNEPPIDWRDQSQPELLRKLCEHLEAFNLKRGLIVANAKATNDSLEETKP